MFANAFYCHTVTCFSRTFFFLLLQEEESHSLLTSSFTALQIKKQPWYFLRDDLHEFNEGLMGR